MERRRGSARGDWNGGFATPCPRLTRAGKRLWTILARHGGSGTERRDWTSGGLRAEPPRPREGLAGFDQILWELQGIAGGPPARPPRGAEAGRKVSEPTSQLGARNG